MARKTYTGMDQFAKYRERRRKGEANRKQAYRKAISRLNKMSREKEAARKKRMRAYEKEVAKEKALKATQNKTVNQMSEQEIQDSGCFVFALLGLVVLVILYFIIGLKWLLIIAGIAVVIFLASVILAVIKEKDNSCNLSEEQINMIQYHLSCIDINKDVANNSNDGQAVKKALDGLIKSIDFIMQYEEEELRQAGATKEKLPAQREFIIQHYEIMIKQAEERTDENKNNSEEHYSNESEILKVTDEEKENKIENNNDIPSLETRLKTAVPSKQGLFPHEILMLSYAHTYKTSANDFQGFWYYLYSVLDPQRILVSLVERGFLSIGGLRETIERLKVSELKDELQIIGEKTTGKKAELVERLMKAGNVQDLEQRHIERYFCLTEKGQQEINENEYVLYLHRLKYMPVWDMNYLLFKDNPSKLGYRDVLWREFNIQSECHFENNDFGLFRNTRLHMYQFLMEEKKYQSAFKMLCEVIAYDLSGLENSENLDLNEAYIKFKLERIIKMGFPYNVSVYRLPPAIIGWIANMKDVLKYTEKEFKDALLKNFEQISLPRRIFTNEECAEIVMDEIGNHPRKLATMYKQVEERLKSELESLN